MKNNFFDKQKLKKVLLIILFLFIFIGFLSYAFLKIDIFGVEKLGIVQNQDISLTFIDGNNDMKLDYNPMSDSSGMVLDDYYEFTVSATSNIAYNMSYYIYMKELSGLTLSSSNVKVYLTKVVDGVETQVLAPILVSKLREHFIEDTVLLYRSFFEFTSAGELSQTYRLRTWVDSDATLATNNYGTSTKNDDGSVDLNVSVNNFSFKLGVNANRFVEDAPTLDTSGANKPVFENNSMIPVYYNETDGEWHKADERNLNFQYKWYDYSETEKMWANAVTVSSANRQAYLDAPLGTVIEMNDINTMWVWIPRYKYTYFSSSSPISINVEFESGTESSGTISCEDNVTGNGSVSETCVDVINGDLVAGTSTYTHPAFSFDGNELRGIWVAKFESSATSIPTEFDNTEHTIIIKPNVQSWRGSIVSNFFQSVRNMEKYNNIYGFTQANETTYTNTGEITGDSNNIDIHVMKNMEWGAVSYLSHSKYGVNSEVYINNSTSYYTGRSAGAAGDANGTTSADGTYQYNDITYGYPASASNTIYGVYDLSGGSVEYVMGNMVNASNEFNLASAGTFAPLRKYYDAYTYSAANNNYSYGKLGDATKELIPTSANKTWYTDYAYFVNTTKPWFKRGGQSSSKAYAGPFNFYADTGENNLNATVRITLVNID